MAKLYTGNCNVFAPSEDSDTHVHNYYAYWDTLISNKYNVYTYTHDMHTYAEPTVGYNTADRAN